MTANAGVEYVQKRLVSLGHDPGPVDGQWGSRTQLAFDAALPAKATQPATALTELMALEIISHEAIIREAYKDSKGIWTWSVGITSASGHAVERYKDNPQSMEHCLGVYVWLLRKKYIPEVLGAFLGHPLTESQLCAAVSFHYNTGAIKRASWVDSWKNGRSDLARKEFMEWRKPPETVERREKERDLFFDGRWSGDGKATVYEVAKPSYSPRWSSAKKVDVSAALKVAMEK